VWINIGEPAFPRLDEPNRRAARNLMARDLQRQYRELYLELCATCGLDPQTAAGDTDDARDAVIARHANPVHHHVGSIGGHS
jgi:hypothetical protein